MLRVQILYDKLYTLSAEKVRESIVLWIYCGMMLFIVSSCAWSLITEKACLSIRGSCQPSQAPRGLLAKNCPDIVAHGLHSDGLRHKTRKFTCIRLTGIEYGTGR